MSPVEGDHVLPVTRSHLVHQWQETAHHKLRDGVQIVTAGEILSLQEDPVNAQMREEHLSFVG